MIAIIYTRSQEKDHEQTFSTRSGESVRAFLLCCCESGEVISSEAFRFAPGSEISIGSDQPRNESCQASNSLSIVMAAILHWVGYSVVLCAVQVKPRDLHACRYGGPSVGGTVVPNRQLGQIIRNSFRCDRIYSSCVVDLSVVNVFELNSISC